MTTKYTTVAIRVKLSSHDDHFSEVPRGELEDALIQLLVTSGVTFTMGRFTYALTDAVVVGR